MQKHGLWTLILLIIGIGMGAVALAQDATSTPITTGPIPLENATATKVPVEATEEAPAILATPTLVPANGESAVVRGPIVAIENVHAVVPLYTSVINNPTLEGDVLPLLINDRILEIPTGWTYTGEAGVAELPPHVRRYDGPGLRYNWDYINGRSGLAQDAIQLFGNQRYAVRMHFRTDLIYARLDTPFTPSHFQAGARLYTAQGGFTELSPQPMIGTENEHIIEWVIESTENPYPFVRLEAYFLMEYPIFIQNVYLERIDIVTVPADYRPEFVNYFE